MLMSCCNNIQTGVDAEEHEACFAPANMHHSPPLPAAAIFSSGRMLGAGVTAESERGMKGLTLCSNDPCLWEGLLRVRESLQEYTNWVAQIQRAAFPSLQKQHHQRQKSGTVPAQGQYPLLCNDNHYNIIT